MRVLVSTCTLFRLTRQAVERARELEAVWASPPHTHLVDEPGHFAFRQPEDFEDQYELPSVVPRHDPVLLRVFDELGPAVVSHEEIVALTIPDDVRYYVDSYCAEWIREDHREWDANGDSWKPPVFALDSVFGGSGS